MSPGREQHSGKAEGKTFYRLAQGFLVGDQEHSVWIFIAIQSLQLVRPPDSLPRRGLVNGWLGTRGVHLLESPCSLLQMLRNHVQWVAIRWCMCYGTRRLKPAILRPEALSLLLCLLSLGMRKIG